MNKKDFMSGKQFREIYKHFNIKMNNEDQRLFHEYLVLDRGTVDIMSAEDVTDMQKYDLT